MDRKLIKPNHMSKHLKRNRRCHKPVVNIWEEMAKKDSERNIQPCDRCGTPFDRYSLQHHLCPECRQEDIGSEYRVHDDGPCTKCGKEASSYSPRNHTCPDCTWNNFREAVAGLTDRLKEYNSGTAPTEEKDLMYGKMNTVPTPPPLVKGALHGLCNRVACQKPGANYYNHSTREHYCEECAELINHHNYADAMRLYGHVLCTQVD